MIKIISYREENSEIELEFENGIVVKTTIAEIDDLASRLERWRKIRCIKKNIEVNPYRTENCQYWDCGLPPDEPLINPFMRALFLKARNKCLSCAYNSTWVKSVVTDLKKGSEEAKIIYEYLKGVWSGGNTNER